MTKELAPKDNTFFDFGTDPDRSMRLLMPGLEDESRILLGCRWTDYSASAISRAVEDCDARLLSLCVTSIPSEVHDVVVFLRVNHRSPESVCRSLARYGYDVIEARGSSSHDTDSMKERANELLRMLEV